MKIRLTAMQSKQFGERLREARKEQRLTQEQLGKAMGATHATVSQWENGIPDAVDGEMLLKAAKTVKRTADWLLYGIEPKIAEAQGGYEIKQGLQELVTAWPYLTNSQRNQLVASAKGFASQNREILDELSK